MTNKNQRETEKSKSDEDTIEAKKTSNNITEQLSDNNDTEQDSSTNEEHSIESLQQQLSEAQNKIDENREHYLAARADADNIQKRAIRDVANAHKFALEKFIPELLGVKDSLELGNAAALEALQNDTETSEQINKFIEGNEMAIKLFADTLAKFGVAKVNPDNEIFNPELHQAMTMVPDDSVPVNTVIEVIQPGYTLNDRLLRPAMVIVSKKS